MEWTRRIALDRFVCSTNVFKIGIRTNLTSECNGEIKENMFRNWWRIMFVWLRQIAALSIFVYPLYMYCKEFRGVTHAAKMLTSVYFVISHFIAESSSQMEVQYGDSAM